MGGWVDVNIELKFNMQTKSGVGWGTELKLFWKCPPPPKKKKVGGGGVGWM